MNSAESVVYLRTGEGEAGIARLVKSLKTDLKMQEAGSLDARMIAALLDIMPGFARALERERALYNDRERASDKDVLDNHLQVLTLPVVNMIGSIILTLAPDNAHLRSVLVAHIFDNVFRGVNDKMHEDEAINGRGH